MLTPDQIRLRLDAVKDAYTRGQIEASFFLLTRLFEDTAPEFAAFVQQAPVAKLSRLRDAEARHIVSLSAFTGHVVDDDDA